MADLVKANDVELYTEPGSGCVILRNEGGDGIWISPEEAVRLGTALKTWGETMVEQGD